MLAKQQPNVCVFHRGGDYESLVWRSGTLSNPRIIPHIRSSSGSKVKPWYYCVSFAGPEWSQLIVGTGTTVNEAYADWHQHYLRIVKPRNPGWTITPV